MTFSMKLTPRIEHTMWGASAAQRPWRSSDFTSPAGSPAAPPRRRRSSTSDKAVVAALAPVCADNFRHATNAEDNLGKLNAINYSWEKGTYVSAGGWATLPGSSGPNSAVAQACAELLSNAAN